MTTVADPRRCPVCRDTHVYHRVTTQTFRCQGCGHVWPAPPPPDAEKKVPA